MLQSPSAVQPDQTRRRTPPRSAIAGLGSLFRTTQGERNERARNPGGRHADDRTRISVWCDLQLSLFLLNRVRERHTHKKRIFYYFLCAVVLSILDSKNTQVESIHHSNAVSIIF